MIENHPETIFVLHTETNGVFEATWRHGRDAWLINGVEVADVDDDGDICVDFDYELLPEVAE